MTANNISDSRGKRSARSTPPLLPSHAHQIMEAFLWNKKNGNKHERNSQREIQLQITSKIHRSNPSSDQQQEEVQPLVPMYSHLSPICENHSSKKYSSQNHSDLKNTINHRHHSNQHVNLRPRQKHHATDQYEDIEDDIVCCDDGRCHEGTKNLCTIVLWALFVFFIIDRIISHVPLHFEKPQSFVSNDAQAREQPTWDDQGERLQSTNSSGIDGDEK
jgi:hypothetical protein